MTISRRSLEMMSKFNSFVNRLAVIAIFSLVSIAGSGVSAIAAPVPYYLHNDCVGGAPITVYTNTAAEYLDPTYLCDGRARVRNGTASGTVDIFAEHVIPNSVVGGMQVSASTTAADNLFNWDGVDSGPVDRIQVKLCEGDSGGNVISCFDQTALVSATTAGNNVDEPLAFAGTQATIGASNTLVVQVLIDDQNRTAYYGYGWDSGRGPAYYDSHITLDIASACSDTNGSAVAITNPVNASTIGGSLSVTATETNVLGTEYRIDGGAWTSIATLWNTLSTHPGSSSAPVAGVLVEVRGEDDECPSSYFIDSVTVTVDNVCAPTGSLAITTGQTLNGNPIDLAGITTLSNSSGEVFTASTGTAPGPAIDEQEYFDNADTLNNWVNWTADGTTSGGTGNPANGELGTFNSGTTINGDGTYSASAGTGPTSVHSGSGFIFREESGGGYPWADRTLTRNSQFDATVNELHISFAYAVNGPSAGTLLLEANDGTGYVTEWSQVGDDGNGGAWTAVDLNLFAGAGASAKSYTSGNVNLRFRWTGGTAFDGDMALDTVRTYGPGRGSLTTLFTGNAAQAATADTTGWTNGSTVTLDLTGNDATCGTPLTAAQDTFTWNSCVNTNTLALTPITDPITGNVNVIATGTAPNIKVGIVPSPTNASGWLYSPAQDDNTTVVSFYAIGDSSCGGTFSVSQLNVATDTMVAPTVANFTIPANVTDAAAPLDVPITTFNAVDNVAVTGYMITIDDAVTPAAGAAGWAGTAPTSVTVPGYASYTFYAWAKDAAGNVSLSASAPVTMSNCTETGTVTVSISPDPDPVEITVPANVTANLGGGASNGMVSWRRDGAAWTSWVASGGTYTPSQNAFGTIEFRAMADGSCGAGSPVTSSILLRTYDTRVDALEPILQSVTQNGLTGIRVVMSYHDDKNNTGTFLVEYKLASEPTTWTIAANMPTTDGGTGDADGTLNEDVVVNLTGLTGGETYDIRMTYMDATDGIIGTAVYNVQLNLIAWVDNPMLHNNLRFAGTTKHGGNWGKPGDYAGAIQCSTCHEKAPANGNIKRIKAAISFPDGSTMPGGSTSAAVSLLTVEDGTSDFGDDSAAPRASSNRVCEACHTHDAAQSVGVKQHAADQSVVSGHYDNSDCIKCHLHNVGFKADCTTCHANPPIGPGAAGLDTSVGTGSATAGKHDYHVNTKGYACNTCHTGWENTGEMPKAGNINIGFNIVLGATTDTTGAYDGRSGGGGYNAAAGTSVTTGNGLSCSAIYCHGSAAPDWSDAGTAVCGSCHGDTNGMPSATPGDGDLSGNTSGSQVGKHPEHVITAGLACATCHKDLGFGTPDHASGSVDIWFDTALAGASATYDTATNTCSNLSCHISKVWDTATVSSCDMCHGYPPLTDGSANDLHVAGATPVDHAGANIQVKHGECNTCHGYSQANGATDNTGNGGDLYQVSFHRDGNIQMNGISAPNNSQSAEYDQATWGCAKACHANDAPHQLSDSALTVQTYEFGSGSCTGCHDGSGAAGTATAISDASPHALGTTGLTCEECHGSHGGGNIEIPNNPAVGINYTANGETGIALGVAVTAPGATEAEICWNCHSGAGVSEWGVNTDTNGAGANYDFGSLNQSNWVGATWTSANFTYKTGTIQSTHSVNSAVAGPGVDAVGEIRCSYCHDVHDLNNATGDTLSGAPYLRGNWMGNPYREDGAPRDTNTYAGNLNLFGAVPRGGSQHTELGGYQIDQNNGNPTNGWTLASSAGLCTLCHGTDVDNLNQFGTAATDWVGTNGHSNAVIGGTGSNSANIFSSNDRNPNGVTIDRVPGNPSTAYMSSQDRGFGFRSIAGAEDEGWDLNPQMNHGDRPYGWNDYDWGATVDANTTDSLYHKFSCSKCHNPHASRLPRLMITNCLDTNHNTWDTKAGVDMLPTGSSIGGHAMGADNSGLPFSNATSAQNCHRRGDNSGNTPAGQYPNATGAGWNNVTPWKEF